MGVVGRHQVQDAALGRLRPSRPGRRRCGHLVGIEGRDVGEDVGEVVLDLVADVAEEVGIVGAAVAVAVVVVVVVGVG
ncbi:hypothetical protein ACTD5D_00010 [Nocardia takedensis]|uniref:hypothetical protein n=1 Tax=Nocardia takedensis TaxID=259390 RepID=UPI003F7642E3